MDEFDASHLRTNVIKMCLLITFLQISGVIVGFDSHFNYMKLMKASSYIARGVPFYVTNEDAVLPCSNYRMPGKLSF